MDRLLDDLGLDLSARREALRLERDETREDFRLDAARVRRVGERYRAEAASLRGLLGRDSRDAAADAVLARRSRESAEATATLRRLASEGRLTSSVATLARSLLHMHANRMLRSAHRPQELVLYDFLHRHDEERSARRGAVGETARTTA
jgi:thiopeptide-type bacteriocin biosynthesis protein